MSGLMDMTRSKRKYLHDFAVYQGRICTSLLVRGLRYIMPTTYQILWSTAGLYEASSSCGMICGKNNTIGKERAIEKLERTQM
jgi:hypothetical protein